MINDYWDNISIRMIKLKVGFKVVNPLVIGKMANAVTVRKTESKNLVNKLYTGIPSSNFRKKRF